MSFFIRRNFRGEAYKWGDCGGSGTAGWRHLGGGEVEKKAMRRGGERKRDGAMGVVLV